jgi:F0F1-type ATP synthase membrane subunit b/b'
MSQVNLTEKTGTRSNIFRKYGSADTYLKDVNSALAAARREVNSLRTTYDKEPSKMEDAYRKDPSHASEPCNTFYKNQEEYFVDIAEAREKDAELVASAQQKVQDLVNEQKKTQMAVAELRIDHAHALGDHIAQKKIKIKNKIRNLLNL